MVEFEQIESELDLYEKGRMLRSLVNSPTWDVVLSILKDYRDKAVDELIALPPGDETVVTAHAAASALDDQFAKFQQDVNNAIKAASDPSVDLQEYLATAKKRFDVKAQMDAVLCAGPKEA